MKEIYVLIGSMYANHSEKKIANCRMSEHPEIASSEEEVKAISSWYSDRIERWVKVYEKNGVITHETIYTWKKRDGSVRISKKPRYTYKKIMEEHCGNLGYDD